MSLENRVSVVEEAILIMKDLLVSHDERLENYFNALNVERNEREESRKDFDFKLNALIDAQIRNQDEISELKEVSKLILKRVERLENQ
jgi:hypothetical protein